MRAIKSLSGFLEVGKIPSVKINFENKKGWGSPQGNPDPGSRYIYLIINYLTRACRRGKGFALSGWHVEDANCTDDQTYYLDAFTDLQRGNFPLRRLCAKAHAVWRIFVNPHCRLK